jgi:hypothetical protein
MVAVSENSFPTKNGTAIVCPISGYYTDWTTLTHYRFYMENYFSLLILIKPIYCFEKFLETKVKIIKVFCIFQRYLSKSTKLSNWMTVSLDSHVGILHNRVKRRPTVQWNVIHSKISSLVSLKMKTDGLTQDIACNPFTDTFLTLT